MELTNLIAQGFGLIGLFIIVYSYQCKQNRHFFLLQGVGGFMFFLNFLMIGAYAGAFFNLTNLVRGLLFSKDDKKVWKLLVTVFLYTFCYLFSIWLVFGNWFQIFLSTLPYVALVIMSVLMWKGSGKHIRYFQVSCMSPAWIVHNIFNFSLGGLICESFSMISVIISFIRYGKDGFEKKH